MATSRRTFTRGSLPNQIEFDPSRVLSIAGARADIYRGTLHLSSHPDGSPFQHTLVALKRMRWGTDDEDTRFDSVIDETHIWRRIRHPNILRFLGILSEVEDMYLVSPLAPFGSLPEYLVAQPGANRSMLLWQISAGIAYLHDQQIIHGDLKGANVLVFNGPTAKISDFGLSKSSDGRESANQHYSLRWTSPECLLGDPLSYSSDVYAFGMIIYEVLSGKTPFSKLDYITCIQAICVNGERPPKLPEVSSTGVSYALLWVLAERCWQLTPDQRPSIFETRDLMAQTGEYSVAEDDSDDLPVLSTPQAPSDTTSGKRKRADSASDLDGSAEPEERPKRMRFIEHLTQSPDMEDGNTFHDLGPSLFDRTQSGYEHDVTVPGSPVEELNSTAEEHAYRDIPDRNSSTNSSFMSQLYPGIGSTSGRTTPQIPENPFPNIANGLSSLDLRPSNPPPEGDSVVVRFGVNTGSLTTPLIEGADEHISFDGPEPFDTRGKFCDLFLGTHRKEGKVALKRLRHKGGSVVDDQMLDRHFQRETNIWVKLRHKRILQFLGAFKHKGHLYFMSPYMKNGALFDWVRSAEPVGSERLRVIFELSEALVYLHSSGIVHGDVKANNVLLSDDLHVQLCDFGLTRLAESNTTTTLKGAGSFRWQSLELWNNMPKTFKSDVYAFAMTIVEVLTSNLPFVDYIHDCAVMMAITGRNERPAKVPTSSSDGTSYAIAWDVAEKCWHKDPIERISMEEATEHLRHPMTANLRPAAPPDEAIDTIEVSSL